MTKTACPLCHCAARTFITSEQTLLRCPSCFLIFYENLPSPKELTDFYTKHYFHANEGSLGYADYSKLRSMKLETFKRRIQLLNRFSPSRGKLLDVGCATGLLVEAARHSGWDAEGLDLSEYAISQAPETLRPHLHCTDLETFNASPASYDAITMIDSLEHTTDPIAVISKVNQLLRPNGKILIETPNAGGILLRLLGGRWPYFRYPEHLFHFSETALKRLLQHCGFKLTTTHSSLKTVTIEYVVEELTSTNPKIAHLISRAVPLTLQQRPISLPTGSFLTLASKVRVIRGI